MNRAVVLLGLVLASDAWALEPYMWGVGPRVGTMFIPLRYPSKFPKVIEDSTDTTLEQFRFDVEWGVEAVYYLARHHRMGIVAGLGNARRFVDAHAILEYDYAAHSGAMDFLFGGGIGFGTHWFHGEDDDELLRIPYYPFRVDTALLIRDNGRGYQLTIYAQYNLPADNFYVDPTGTEVDVTQGINFAIGAELAVLFGDFTPPRARNTGPTPTPPPPPVPQPVPAPAPVPVPEPAPAPGWPTPG